MKYLEVHRTRFSNRLNSTRLTYNVLDIALLLFLTVKSVTIFQNITEKTTGTGALLYSNSLFRSTKGYPKIPNTKNVSVHNHIIWELCIMLKTTHNIDFSNLIMRNLRIDYALKKHWLSPSPEALNACAFDSCLLGWGCRELSMHRSSRHLPDAPVHRVL